VSRYQINRPEHKKKGNQKKIEQASNKQAEAQKNGKELIKQNKYC
jgi:uncharacterized membrane protein (DUF106 family)